MTSHVVIGGSGFIGRHLVRALLEAGDSVQVVDRFALPVQGFPAPVCHLDPAVAGPADYDAAVGMAEVIHHYAWTTIPAQANSDPLKDLEDNLRLTLGLLDALSRRGGGRLVFLSSGGTVYGRLSQVPVPESHPLEPTTAYGVSKIAAEKYLGFYRAIHGIDTRVLRLSNPYGAGQSPARQQGAVTTFIHRALAGETIELWGDGTVVRDFLHIADLVPALVAAGEVPHPAMPVLNIGSGEPTSLNDVLAAIGAALGRQPAVEYRPHRGFDVPVSVLDVRAASRLLGWAPRISLADGVAQVIEDLRQGPGRSFASGVVARFADARAGS